VKPHIRIIGIDDGPFDFGEEKCLFAGVLMRMPDTVEGMALSSIAVDGDDSAFNISRMMEREGWDRLAHVIMTDGASMGGFNLIDTDEIYQRTGVPAMTVTHERPDMESIKDAMKGHFDDWKERFEWLESREIHEVSVDEGLVFISFSGMGLEDAKAFVRKSIVRGLTPEPIRLAHMIARAVRRC
jgi:endonuclease V-like protein UPF0215 family